ncbi:MAG: transposase zinc-binding domain-containing protein [Solobacterium sp.]|nr:transposase zinc-binding domain-containing protein [Solobacterium sp.]MDD6498070.1 transposase zinc-binding domain-containing protein [Solobacterium sp.]
MKNELKEEILEEVDGGLLRKPYVNTDSGYKMMRCNDCGHEFYNYVSISNHCPECGSSNTGEQI